MRCLHRHAGSARWAAASAVVQRALRRRPALAGAYAEAALGTASSMGLVKAAADIATVNVEFRSKVADGLLTQYCDKVRLLRRTNKKPGAGGSQMRGGS